MAPFAFPGVVLREGEGSRAVVAAPHHRSECTVPAPKGTHDPHLVDQGQRRDAAIPTEGGVADAVGAHALG